MKSPTLLWKIMAEDLAIRCHTSATMDINTVQGRFKHEGMSFLTISLPSYCKSFQHSLDNGIVSRNSFQGFSWRAGLPVFLRGFLENVFDRASGVLLEYPDVEAIYAIRQLTLLYSKILLPCSSKRESEAMSGYIECEKEVTAHSSGLSSEDLSDFESMAFRLFAPVFSKLDKLVYDETLVPKHGPGATADKLHGNMKYSQRTWTDRLEEVFHCGDFLFANNRYYSECYDEVTFLEPGDEMPVKVISVPKTQKTPRIIAIEPTCMQYMQQALLEPMVQYLESSDLLGPMIGFSDQTPNQSMALDGSLYGNLATLDLSEASDRVSWRLVKSMVSKFPHLLRALDATRSRQAAVPGHGVVTMSKYASMGSALCFPIEAMVFLTCVFLGIQEERNTPFCRKREFIHAHDEVRVYGDDLIVPVDCVHSVILQLERFGAKVGGDKSYWTGRFRESCGKEFYEGSDVTAVKVRREFPANRKNAPEVISLVSLRNQLYEAGCWRTVRYLDGKIQGMLKHFPVVLPSSSVLGRISFLREYDVDRICEHLHAPLVKGYVVSSRLPRNSVDGPDAMLKCFLKRGDQPVADRRHLERSGRPRSVDIKPRWAQPV